MANPACSFCEQNEAILMITNLMDGDTQTPCASCVTGAILQLASVLTHGMEPEEATAYGELLDAIYANDPRAPKIDRLRPKTRTRKTPPPEPAADGPEDDATASVSLVPPCDACGSETATGTATELTCDGCGKVLATANGDESAQAAPQAVTKSDVALQDE